MTVTELEWQTEPRYALNEYGLIDGQARWLIRNTVANVRAAGGRVRHTHFEDRTGVVDAVTETGSWLIAWDDGTRSEETPFTVTAPLRD
ncbi:hypothetical protein [Nocardia asteroides]